MSASSSRFVALLPAAGSGSRMGSVRPKQYLPLLGQPLIFYTISALLADVRIGKLVVVLAPDDGDWCAYDWTVFGSRLMPLFCGGRSRAESVLNGLHALADQLDEQDWVLVHDAARPCLSPQHLDALFSELQDDPVGGILAVPVADTLKRMGQTNTIAGTVDRSGLWQAQTPQMFRYGLLRTALAVAQDVTDEASAVEQAGFVPRLVAGDMTNLKVTYPLDLHLASLILNDRKGCDA